jgi:hypothetical protein
MEGFCRGISNNPAAETQFQIFDNRPNYGHRIRRLRIKFPIIQRRNQNDTRVSFAQQQFLAVPQDISVENWLDPREIINLCEHQATLIRVHKRAFLSDLSIVSSMRA